jgi:hypothetical protein
VGFRDARTLNTCCVWTFRGEVDFKTSICPLSSLLLGSTGICKKNKKQVIYSGDGKPKENDPLYPVYVQFERFRAA